MDVSQARKGKVLGEGAAEAGAAEAIPDDAALKEVAPERQAPEGSCSRAASHD